MIRFPFFFTLRFCLLACVFSGVLSLVPAASAQEKAKDASIIYPRNSDAAKPEAGVATHSTGYGSGILVFALLLAGAGGWLFWRGRATPAGTLNARKLAIAETKSLGNRQYLVVAAYEDKKFLLSVCPGRIELLTPLDGSTPPAKTS